MAAKQSSFNLSRGAGCAKMQIISFALLMRNSGKLPNGRYSTPWSKLKNPQKGHENRQFLRIFVSLWRFQAVDRYLQAQLSRRKKLKTSKTQNLSTNSSVAWILWGDYLKFFQVEIQHTK